MPPEGVSPSPVRKVIPVLAIDGISAERATAVRARGGAGVAVIRAILAADDPSERPAILSITIDSE
jgi:thiamine monophosphate synthase